MKILCRVTCAIHISIFPRRCGAYDDDDENEKLFTACLIKYNENWINVKYFVLPVSRR